MMLYYRYKREKEGKGEKMELTTIVVNTIEELKEVNPIVINGVNPETLQIFHAHCYNDDAWLKWNAERGEYEDTSSEDIFKIAKEWLNSPDAIVMVSF